MVFCNSLKKKKQTYTPSLGIIYKWEESSNWKSFLKHSYEPFPQKN